MVNNPFQRQWPPDCQTEEIQLQTFHIEIYCRTLNSTPGTLEHMDMELLVHLIMSACVLHNFCLLNDDFDEGYFLDCGDGADDDDGEIDGGPHAGPLPTAEAKRVQLMNIVC